MATQGISPWEEWVGAIHVHSTHSDGRGTVETIIKAARSVDLDFCILTDHDTLAALPHEGYSGSLLFLVGSEVTCANDSHYLALGVKQSIPRGLPPQQAIDTVRTAGGIGIVAHPFDRGSPLFKTHYPWKQWAVDGYDALEMWTFLVNWAEGITNIVEAAWGYMFPNRFLTGPNPEGLRRWDALNQKRFARGQPPLPIVGSVDAHGYFTYRRSLATIRTHLWAPPKQHNLDADRRTVLRAIRSGQSFVANDAIHNARGFRFEVVGDRMIYPEHRADIRGPANIRVTTPYPALIRILRDGNVAHTVEGTSAAYPASKAGTYRCEVFARSLFGVRPWIYSNSVHVRVG